MPARATTGRGGLALAFAAGILAVVAITITVLAAADSWHTLLIDNGAVVPLLPLLLLTTLAARRSLRQRSLGRQANAVVENRGLHLGMSPPRRFNHNLYENDRLNSWQRVTGCPTWLLLFYVLRWCVSCYFDRGSRLLNVPEGQGTLAVFDSDVVTWNDTRPRQPRRPR
jgi:hypothetical protein